VAHAPFACHFEVSVLYYYYYYTIHHRTVMRIFTLTFQTIIAIHQINQCYYLTSRNWGILSSLSVCLSVWRISLETFEQIRLNFCTETEVCPEYYFSHFDGKRPSGRGPARKPKIYCVSHALTNLCEASVHEVKTENYLRNFLSVRVLCSEV